MNASRRSLLRLFWLVLASLSPAWAYTVEGFSGVLTQATPPSDETYLAVHATLRCFYESYNRDSRFEKNPNLDVTLVREELACGKKEVYFSSRESGRFDFPSLTLKPEGVDYGKFYVLSVQIRVAQGARAVLTRKEQRQKPQKQFVNADAVLEGELQYTTLAGGRPIERLASDLDEIVLYHLPPQDLSLALSGTDLPSDLEVICSAAIVDSTGRGCNAVFGSLGASTVDPVHARANVEDPASFQTPELFFISLGRQTPRPVLVLSLSLVTIEGNEPVTLFEKEGAIAWPRDAQELPQWASLFGKPKTTKP